ncbi:hypothetical protein HID58_092938, partial [Brassica napus]
MHIMHMCVNGKRLFFLSLFSLTDKTRSHSFDLYRRRSRRRPPPPDMAKKQKPKKASSGSNPTGSTDSSGSSKAIAPKSTDLAALSPSSSKTIDLPGSSPSPANTATVDLQISSETEVNSEPMDLVKPNSDTAAASQIVSAQVASPEIDVDLVNAQPAPLSSGIIPADSELPSDEDDNPNDEGDKFINVVSRRIQKQLKSKEELERIYGQIWSSYPALLILLIAPGRCWFTLAKAEESYLYQRSRVNWIDVGDSNSTYYHRSLRSRQAVNQIIFLTDDNGAIIDTSEGIKAHALQFYQNLLGGTVAAS